MSSYRRHRITLQIPAGTKTARGSASDTWVSYLTAWAKITPLTGTERYTAGTQSAQVTHEVAMPWARGITADMRISFGSRYLHVVSVIDVDERHRELLLMCEEVL